MSVCDLRSATGSKGNRRSRRLSFNSPLSLLFAITGMVYGFVWDLLFVKIKCVFASHRTQWSKPMLHSYHKSYYFLKSQFDCVGGKWNSLVGNELLVTPLCTRTLNAIQYSCNGIAFLTPSLINQQWYLLCSRGSHKLFTLHSTQITRCCKLGHNSAIAQLQIARLAETMLVERKLVVFFM